MVIGKPTKEGVIPVILKDDELIPVNLNAQRVLIFRQGESTGRQLAMVKPLGVVLPPGDPLLLPPSRPICNFALDPEVEPSPLHEHADGTWWFYEATWTLEQGPYATFDEGLAAMTQYCIEYQNSLTKAEKSDTVKDDETPKTSTE